MKRRDEGSGSFTLTGGYTSKSFETVKEPRNVNSFCVKRSIVSILFYAVRFTWHNKFHTALLDRMDKSFRIVRLVADERLSFCSL